MTGLRPAMEALAAVIEAETAALAAGDYPAAGRLSREKAGAAERFLAARARHAASPPPRLAEPGVAGTLERLRGAVAANRAALERALAVQGRVIEAVARAARPPGTGGYARRPPVGSPPPVALLVRS
jgi:hypothetical protein